MKRRPRESAGIGHAEFGRRPAERVARGDELGLRSQKLGIDEVFGCARPIDCKTGMNLDALRQGGKKAMSRQGHRGGQSDHQGLPAQNGLKSDLTHASARLTGGGRTEHVQGSSLPFHAKSMVGYGNQPVKHRKNVTDVPSFSSPGKTS